MQVSMDKQYRTEDGRKVRILCIDHKNKIPELCVLALVQNTDKKEDIYNYTLGGINVAMRNDVGDNLVEVTPWEDFEIDEPVLAAHESEAPFKAHFAGRQEGTMGQIFPTVFPNGCTSWTCVSKDRVFVDNVFKLPEFEKPDVGVKIEPELMDAAMELKKQTGITIEKALETVIRRNAINQFHG